jgi:hypothetical protein
LEVVESHLLLIGRAQEGKRYWMGLENPNLVLVPIHQKGEETILLAVSWGRRVYGLHSFGALPGAGARQDGRWRLVEVEAYIGEVASS